MHVSRSTAKFVNHQAYRLMLNVRLFSCVQQMNIAMVFNKLVIFVQGNIVENSCFPNLNFSVSHHGDFVALASEPHALVGLDIMIPDPEEEAAPEEYIKNFRSCFTLLEWKNINSVGPDKRLLLDQFCRYFGFLNRR